MATYVHRPGSKRPHQVRWYDHEGKRRSKQFTNRRDAQKYVGELETARDTGRLQLVGADRQTLRDMGGKHFKAIRNDLATTTRTNYANQWNRHVNPHPIAGTPLRSITPQTVENFKADLRVYGAGEASIGKCLMLIQAVLGRAVNEGIIAFNPATAVKKPSAKRVGTVQPISPEGVEAIRRQLGDTDALMVSVLAYAGLRPGEARALEWRHIKSKTLLIEQATDPDGTIKPTKTGQTRSVRLIDALRADLDATKGSGFIFARTDGRSWTETDWRNWRKRKFVPAAERAGVAISRPYDLRHSIASLWLRERIDAVTVARWLGHAPTMLLSTYAHVIADLDPNDRRTADELIAAARFGVS